MDSYIVLITYAIQGCGKEWMPAGAEWEAEHTQVVSLLQA